MFEVASSDLVNMGITVVSYTLKDIRDEEVSQTQAQLLLRLLKTHFHNFVELRQGKTSFTDLGSLIENTQCGNFRIFLPFRFCVKSILIIDAPKTAANLTILADLIF